MAVAQPDVLFVLNESSGSTVVNDGTEADSSVGQGVENTDWAWNNGLGSFDGYWESLNKAGSNMAWIALGLTGISTSLQNKGIAIGFSIDGWDTRASSRGYLYGANSAGEIDGDVAVRVSAPTSTGDFDLTVFWRGTGAAGPSEIVFADLSFATVYQLAVSCDGSNPSSSVIRAKLDAGAVQVSATPYDYSVSAFNSSTGWIGRSGGFSNYYGIDGRIHYLAYQRGTLWSDSDLADINSDPAANITGWPGGGGGGSIIPKIQHHRRRR